MANTYKKWKGAVEPAHAASDASGNEYKRWKGAVEPAGVAGVASRLGGFDITFGVTRNVTRGVTEHWSNK